MFRAIKKPIPIPAGVECRLSAGEVVVKGPKGQLSSRFSDIVAIVAGDDNTLRISAASAAMTPRSKALLGTVYALLNNMLKGVSAGFERRLLLTGVGYRAALSGDSLTLSLGFSHPVKFKLPTGVKASLSSPTEIVLSGADTQQLGQVAANIIALRPTEPYKGKGIRLAGSRVRRKEARKKKA